MAQLQQILESSSLLLGFFSLFNLLAPLIQLGNTENLAVKKNINCDEREQLPTHLWSAVSMSCNTT